MVPGFMRRQHLVKFLALDVGSGAIAWRKSFGSPIRSAPTVSNGRVFFSNVGNDVFALSTADGNELWRYQGSTQQASIIASNSPAVSGNYVTVPYTTGDLLTFEASSGALAWSDNLIGRTASNTASTAERHCRPSGHRGKRRLCHLPWRAHGIIQVIGR